MIKTQVYIQLIISALALFFAGCDRVPDYDKRLVKVDSLVYDHPKEAKDNLLKINPKELNKADEAYYNLLLTQTSYINYDDITSDNDSIITQALEYYKHHKGDREKFTRANLYKGAVLEELGISDSLAMVFYKEAEHIAGDNDHFNRGYAQYSMGKLYAKYKAYDGRDIVKLEQAVTSFRKANNRIYLILSLKKLGSLYRYRKADQAEVKLNEAISLAKSIDDDENFINSVNDLAYLYFMQSTKVEKDSVDIVIKKAYDQLQRIKSLKINNLNANVYTTFACVYANMGKVDSASMFLGLARQTFGNDSISNRKQSYLEAKSQIAKAQNKMEEYYRLGYENLNIHFANIRNQDIINIINSELGCDTKYKNEKDKERNIMYGIMAGLMALLLLLALWFYRRSHRYDKLVLELKDQSSSQLSDLSSMQQNISEMQINDERLKSFISSHMSMMREVIDACYHEPNNRIAENMKRIIKFQESNKDNWVKLYDYIDIEHNNIMARTREQYPQLNDKDLLLLALTCMGYSYIQTAIIMGYSNATSVSVLKQRLAQKMGLEGSLNEYIEQNSNAKNE